jgi:hypothetical protein
MTPLVAIASTRNRRLDQRPRIRPFRTTSSASRQMTTLPARSPGRLGHRPSTNGLHGAVVMYHDHNPRLPGHNNDVTAEEGLVEVARSYQREAVRLPGGSGTGRAGRPVDHAGRLRGRSRWRAARAGLVAEQQHQDDRGSGEPYHVPARRPSRRRATRPPAHHQNLSTWIWPSGTSASYRVVTTDSIQGSGPHTNTSLRVRCGTMLVRAANGSP